MTKAPNRILTFFQVFFSLFAGWPGISTAIVVVPNELQIQGALKKGEEAALKKKPPNSLYWQFGRNSDLKPHGSLITKMNGLTVMSSHFALRSEKPSRQDIEQILVGSELQVVITVFGSSPQFAVNSYVVLRQRDQLIKPQRIRSDGHASRSSAWPEAPAYKARIVAAFSYASFDPEALTTIVIFPGEGGEIDFDMDFSTIP